MPNALLLESDLGISSGHPEMEALVDDFLGQLDPSPRAAPEEKVADVRERIAA